MQSITEETTIGEIVRAVPAYARIFDSLGIDYCCGGKIALAQACGQRGLDLSTVIAMFSAIDGVADASLPDVDLMSLSGLCDHIRTTHHAYLREELPRLDFMAKKVAAVHGEHEPRLLEIRDLFEAFYAMVASHTRQEDENIFPEISKLDAASGEGSKAELALKPLLDGLEEEHERTGAALLRFQELTDRYAPPEWACNTFRAFYDGLARLEADTHQHVHKENNVLFPKALAAVAGSGSGD